MLFVMRLKQNQNELDKLDIAAWYCVEKDCFVV